MSESNGYATRESIFSDPPVRQYADAVIDGHKFRLRSLTAMEANGYQLQHLIDDDREDALLTANARLIVLCAVDGNGNQIFTKEDVDKLLERSSAFVSKLATVCQRHAQLNVEVEDSKKNSAKIPG